MIVVMPAGHVNGAGSALGAPVPPAAAQRMPGIGTGPDPFANDFFGDVMPHIEKNYRVVTERQSRAIAGLSMGGNQTLNIAIPHLEKFAYIGVFSSGIISVARGAAPSETASAFGEAWEKQNLAALDKQARPRPPVVEYRQRRQSDHDHAEHGGAPEEAWLQAHPHRERRRAYVAQLARLSVGIRAAAVPAAPIVDELDRRRMSAPSICRVLIKAADRADPGRLLSTPTTCPPVERTRTARRRLPPRHTDGHRARR
jgi:S-formylglutathione hydrolase FrmB